MARNPELSPPAPHCGCMWKCPAQIPQVPLEEACALIFPPPTFLMECEQGWLELILTGRIKAIPSDCETTGLEGSGSLGTPWSTAAISALGYLTQTSSVWERNTLGSCLSHYHFVFLPFLTNRILINTGGQSQVWFPNLISDDDRLIFYGTPNPCCRHKTNQREQSS